MKPSSRKCTACSVAFLLVGDYPRVKKLQCPTCGWKQEKIRIPRTGAG